MIEQIPKLDIVQKITHDLNRRYKRSLRNIIITDIVRRLKINGNQEYFVLFLEDNGYCNKSYEWYDDDFYLKTITYEQRWSTDDPWIREPKKIKFKKTWKIKITELLEKKHGKDISIEFLEYAIDIKFKEQRGSGLLESLVKNFDNYTRELERHKKRTRNYRKTSQYYVDDIGRPNSKHTVRCNKNMIEVTKHNVGTFNRMPPRSDRIKRIESMMKNEYKVDIKYNNGRPRETGYYGLAGWSKYGDDIELFMDWAYNEKWMSAVLYHEMGHILSRRYKKEIGDGSPRKYADREYDAWERGIALASMWGDLELFDEEIFQEIDTRYNTQRLLIPVVSYYTGCKNPRDILDSYGNMRTGIDELVFRKMMMNGCIHGKYSKHLFIDTIFNEPYVLGAIYRNTLRGARYKRHSYEYIDDDRMYNLAQRIIDILTTPDIGRRWSRREYFTLLDERIDIYKHGFGQSNISIEVKSEKDIDDFIFLSNEILMSFVYPNATMKIYCIEDNDTTTYVVEVRTLNRSYDIRISLNKDNESKELLDFFLFTFTAEKMNVYNVDVYNRQCENREKIERIRDISWILNQ